MPTKKLLARSLKSTFSPSSVFVFFSLHQTTKQFLAFIKPTVHPFVISVTCAWFSVDWLTNFQRWENLIGFFEFHIAHSEILLTACLDQLLYNLSLIKLCLACVKQNAVVKTKIDTSSLLAK